MRTSTRLYYTRQTFSYDNVSINYESCDTMDPILVLLRVKVFRNGFH